LAPATHVPPALQASFCVQRLLSALQPVPGAMGEQIPWLPPTLHATQSVVDPAPHAVLQQNPSTQLLVEHSWQPAVLQSPPPAPDARLHVPATFHGTHVPVLSQ
jgi:hypothetical protein